MRDRISVRQLALLAVTLVAAGFVLTGCYEDKRASPSSAFCGYIVGSGEGKHDNNLHHTLLPGQTKDYDSTKEDAKYVPCNPRNYYVLPKEVDTTSDRDNPSLARTTEGTEVKVWSRMYWRLNQDEKALNEFFDVCTKYKCFSSEPTGGESNNSTEGWNDMLEETFSPTIDQGAFTAMAGYTGEDEVKHEGFDDTIWEVQSPDAYQKLAVSMAELFMQDVQAKTGFSTDLFCGSSSAWVGKGKARSYGCRSVFFEIYKVEPVEQKLLKAEVDKKQEDKQAEVNRKRISNARILYGDGAGEALALQDAIKECKTQAKATCIVNLGGGPVVTAASP